MDRRLMLIMAAACRDELEKLAVPVLPLLGMAGKALLTGAATQAGAQAVAGMGKRKPEAPQPMRQPPAPAMNQAPGGAYSY